MANKELFKSSARNQLVPTDGQNSAGSPAYKFSPEHSLAQHAMTGCMNGAFYTSARDQLDDVLRLVHEVSPEYIARLAIYSREKGYMKDLPALLCAVLSVRDVQLLRRVFHRVLDNGKMVRNFVQIIRSGLVGRRSLGTIPKKLVLEWLEKRSEEALLHDSVGNSPSLADIVKMVHPKPGNPEREALYGYLLKKEYDPQLLPAVVKEFEAFKAKTLTEVPKVPFQLLTSLALSKDDWQEIARTASWQTTRMNLNTFGRHGVFEDPDLVQLLAKRLADEDEIKKARVFPYQLLIAFKVGNENVPPIIRAALQDAMEIAVKNVPQFPGHVVVCPDVSGSMSSSATGFRKGSTSDVRHIDIAALIAATVMRRNSTALVLPFEQKVVDIDLNPRDSIMTNAQRLASIGGGGTNCSAPLALLNQQRIKADMVIFVSDNESWADVRRSSGTAMMEEWQKFKVFNPKARLVCIDVQPYSTTQAQERYDILNVGGFSDHVFEIISQFANGTLNSDHLVGLINNIEL